ncbi:hypothetical protein H6P81_016584 [Aristolochia fimbriata]|uniref:Uncharacterized protein n=1 Tax=Aristolochia fimbriata TaxID=158543 RepID=A0AAV7E9D8_ARIFI|nr:hypothetical protein H6P81_016584 [Aristolochia fimbriata]
MENHKNKELRDRFDKALSSPNLMDENSIRELVRDQLCRSSSWETEDIIEGMLKRRTAEVSNFLQMLRSASGNNKDSRTQKTSENDWKLKQDNDQLRVMYREGPKGTPFHTLLAEGYVDGPLDICLCVSWESTLYKKWWPQFSIPPFKIITSASLQKVRTGEEISLVRVKVPWPVSAREAVVHYFELEYFEEELVIVLINTVSDTEEIDVRTHGFSSDKIPEANDTVRIGLVGGFALQKVNSNRSYFRTIANMDIKIDFVPPALINFISRQLIGSGFKLYQKVVASVASGDDSFRKALEEDMMYIRIRKALNFPQKESNTSKILDNEDPSNGLLGKLEESLAKEAKNETALVNLASVTNQTSITEIIEEEIQQETPADKNQHVDQLSTKPSVRSCEASKESDCISPEVEWALGVLDRAIDFFLGSGNTKTDSSHMEREEIASISSSHSDRALKLNSTDKAEKDGEEKPADETEGSFSFPNVRFSKVDSPMKATESLQNGFPLAKENLRFWGSEEGKLESSYDSEVAGGSTGLNGIYHDAGVKADEAHESHHNKGGEEKFKQKGKKQRHCCLWLQPYAKSGTK